MNRSRSRLITTAIAGILTVAGAVSAAAATLPSSSAPSSAVAADSHLAAIAQRQDVALAAQGDTESAAQRLIMFDHVRSSIGERQLRHEGAAAKAAAARRAAAKAAAAARAAARAGSPRQIAEQMLSQFGWPGSQFSCLQPLWEQESRWSVSAENPSSGAYGIPQALPGSRMASAGADWQTRAATQIRWGLRYIQGTYGSPCAAWGHEQADGWY